VLDGALQQRALVAKWLPRAAIVVAAVVVGTTLYARQVAKVTNVASTAPATTAAPPSTATGAQGGTGGSTTTKAAAPTTTTPGGSGPTTTVATGTGPAGPVEPGLQSQDLSCQIYDPLSITIQGPAGSTSTTTSAPGPAFAVTTNNPHVMFQFANQTDATTARSVLSQYTQVCVIGQGAPLALQAMTLEPYKAGSPGVPTGTQEKCDHYNNADGTLLALPPDNAHVNYYVADTSQTPALRLQSFDTSDGARVGRLLARQHSQRCWIGGGTSFVSLDGGAGGSILEYWR
jgi:hypothetical protein